MLAFQTKSTFNNLADSDDDEFFLQGQEDYYRVKSALAYMNAHWRQHPAIEEVASHCGVSLAQFNAIFRRWAGISPKMFLQALTLDYARKLLRENASILDASFELGLSGPSRLHDLFVTYEAMSPGDFKAGGAGLTFFFGYHPSPFGEALLVAGERGLSGLGFVADGDRKAALADLSVRWPFARMIENSVVTKPYAEQAFDPRRWRKDQPLRLILIGADFELRVWETLLKIPCGGATSYGGIATYLGQPKAARAVGRAVGRNPISFVVPCHRVVGKSGALTGYHWGIERKQAMIGWEAGTVAGRSI